MQKLKLILLGFFFCLAQVVFLLALAPPSPSLGARYLKLNNWDSFHYQRIAEEGYQIPSGTIRSEDIHAGRANVVFFPGYPMLARAASRAFSIPVPYALLLVSQLAAWVFWCYFFLLLEAHAVSRKRALLFGTMILFHPAAFFLVAGYTESLFLAGLLGLIFWTDRWAERGGWGAWILAAVHGFMMSATRIVAFAASIYPVLKAKRKFLAVVLGGFAVVGAFAFFYYCQVRFGRWNLYFQLEEIGWHNERKYFAILNPLSYIPHFFFEDTVDSFNRLSVLITALMFLRFQKKSLAMFVVAFFLFYIPLTGKAAANMDSMVRYTLPVFVLIVVAWAQSVWVLPKRRWPYFAASFFGLAVQVWFAYRFLRGHWVA